MVSQCRRSCPCLCRKRVYPNWHMAVQGFPPRDVLRTVYVEHDIDASEAETPVVDFVFADKALQGARPARRHWRQNWGI